MIAAATGPFAATAEGLHALYVSLNSPVVSLEGLPVGPAAAAIAVHGPGTTLLIRSVRTGTVAWFSAEARFGLESALSRAEALGFLFDDEANLASEGVERSSWPDWIAEIFSAESEVQEFADVSGWLSKFRWPAPARRPTQSADAQRAQVSRSEPEASEVHRVGERRRAPARARDHGHP
jgi:hypothetical protein